MSIAIQVDNVLAVLVGGQWFEVADESFDLDSYEYLHGQDILHGGGQYGACANGCTFKPADGTFLAGPLTAIRAGRYTQKRRS